MLMGALVEKDLQAATLSKIAVTPWVVPDIKCPGQSEAKGNVFHARQRKIGALGASGRSVIPNVVRGFLGEPGAVRILTTKAVQAVEAKRKNVSILNDHTVQSMASGQTGAIGRHVLYRVVKGINSDSAVVPIPNHSMVDEIVEVPEKISRTVWTKHVVQFMVDGVIGDLGRVVLSDVV